MVRIYCLFALLLFSAFSCSKEDEEPGSPLEKFPAPVTLVEVPEHAQVGHTVPIVVHFTVNNGCGHFKSFAVEQKSDAMYIEVYPKYVGETCYQALMTRQATYNFKPEHAGTYTLKFWSEHPDTYITKTIIVSTGD